MYDKFFWKNNCVVAFNPLQIANGLAHGLRELTEEEYELVAPTPHDTTEGGSTNIPPIVYPEMSSLDFLRLFDPERRAIKQAAMQDVDIGIWYDDTVAAQYVTYSDPRVESGLSALVSAGLLTEARKTEVISLMTLVV